MPNDDATPSADSLAAEVEKKSIFCNMMTDMQSSRSMAVAKRWQTSPDMPIVVINDPAKKAGDTVTCDLLGMLQGTPTMGDNEIEGQGAPLAQCTMEVGIGEMCFPADVGSRGIHARPFRMCGSNEVTAMASWLAGANDQIVQIHLAGARGSENTEDWHVPLDTRDARDRFKRIMVNDVLPPTTNRYFVAGHDTSVDDPGASLGDAAALKLEHLDVISTVLRGKAFPPSPIKVRNDPDDEAHPIWCLLVTRRQWRCLRAADSQAWQMFTSDAQKPARTCNHPLFAGEAGLWNDLLVKPMPRAIHFEEGDTVKTTVSATGTVQCHTVPAGVKGVDRAILLGGQALAWARGSADGSRSGCPMRWPEGYRDRGNPVEIGAAQVDGKTKLRFRDRDNVLTDLGVAVIDSYAPDPQSPEGKKLLAALRS